MPLISSKGIGNLICLAITAYDSTVNASAVMHGEKNYRPAVRMKISVVCVM